MRKKSSGWKTPKVKILITLPEADHEALRQMASHERTSVNALIRSFLFEPVRDWRESGIKEDKTEW